MSKIAHKFRIIKYYYKIYIEYVLVGIGKYNYDLHINFKLNWYWFDNIGLSIISE